jgi:hypothetical protein
MALCAHSTVREDLRNRILCSRALLAIMGSPERLDIVKRVVVADELECISNALDEIFLTNWAHDVSFWRKFI